MRSQAELERLLRHILGDERYRAKPARVQINAPLALIQVELEARVNVLRWVLDLDEFAGGSAGSLKGAS